MRGLVSILQRSVRRYYDSSGAAAYDWAGRTIAEGRFKRVLDVGCGDGSRLFNYFGNWRPDLFCGIEGNAQLAARARGRGIEVRACDLNGAWPFESNAFDAVHATQVIEHIHNTRMFLAETFRVLTPGGMAVITSENLCSLLNLFAMALGYTPFSLINVCGWYLGNPLGLHVDRDFEEHASLELPSVSDPAFSGVAGHMRVLSVPQARDLLEKTGFAEVRARSIGLMPLPGRVGRALETLMPRRGHWLMVQAMKSRHLPVGHGGEAERER